MGAGASTQKALPLEAALDTVEAYAKTDAVEGLDAFGAKYDLVEDQASFLGEGSFGQVFRCYTREGGEMRAVKIVDSARMSPEATEELHNEVLLLSHVEHRHALKMHDFYEDKPTKRAFIVTDCLEGGELFDRVVEKTYYSEDDARRVIVVLIELCVYLHERGISHRDLKLENLILKSRDDDAGCGAGVIDFGLACHESNEPLANNQCGTPNYVAPEIVAGDGPYGASCDMWAIGVIAYTLLSGVPPFDEEDDTDLFRAIKAGVFGFPEEYWGAVSGEAKDIVTKLLAVDRAERLDAKHAILHPWFVHEHHEAVADHCRRYSTSRVAPHLKGTLARLKEHGGKLRGKKRFKFAALSVRQSLRAINNFRVLPKKSATGPPTSPSPAKKKADGLLAAVAEQQESGLAADTPGKATSLLSPELEAPAPDIAPAPAPA